MNKLDVYDISIEELVCLLSSFFMYLSPTALFSLISLVLFTFLCFHTCTFICDVLLPCSFIPYQDLWAFGFLSFLSHLQVKTATNSSVFPFIFYMGFFLAHAASSEFTYPSCSHCPQRLFSHDWKDIIVWHFAIISQNHGFINFCLI